MTSPPPPSKQLIVVAGPNGAGKTTFALKYAAEYGLPYLGADAIAHEVERYQIVDCSLMRF